MSSEKQNSEKAKGGRKAVRRGRNPEGVSMMWGGGDEVTRSAKAGGDNGRPPRRKRNPATLPEESEGVRRANELLLRVWENIHARRDRFGKPDKA